LSNRALVFLTLALGWLQLESLLQMMKKRRKKYIAKLACTKQLKKIRKQFMKFNKQIKDVLLKLGREEVKYLNLE